MKKNIKLTPIRLIHYTAGGSLGLFIILTLVMLLPSTHHTASATCATGDNSELCVSSQAATELSVNLKTSISVALENQVNLDITPTSSGATGYSSAKLSVSTNSNEGYGIFLSTDTANGDLLSTSSNNDAMISNTSLNNVTLANLDRNSYGYALESTAANDSTKYSHIPTANTAIKTTNSTTASGADYAYGDTYYLSFGAKISTDIPAGSYAGTITVSAVANPRTIANLSDLTYMQDMTANICDNTREGYTKQLIDSRDGKSYWVAKLKDGNCWMTQNLAFTITQDMIDNGSINSSNTDIAFTWGNEPAWTDRESWYTLSRDGIGDDYSYYNYPGEYLKPSATENTIFRFDFGNYFTAKSWDLGEIVLVNPTSSESCTIANNSANCKQIKDVMGWEPSYVATETSAVNETNNTYDAHYLIGNYYQFNTATAGTGTELRGDYSAGSICPKGWMIPLDFGMSEYIGNFSGLLNEYGMMEDDYSGNTSGISDGKTYNIVASPLYFAQAGNNYDRGVTLGESGSYWTSYARDSISAYAMHFTEGFVSINMGDDKDYAFSVRCVAR